MNWWEMLLAVVILASAIYLLYRSLAKKQGYCPGCHVASCPGKQPPWENNLCVSSSGVSKIEAQ